MLYLRLRLMLQSSVVFVTFFMMSGCASSYNELSSKNSYTYKLPKPLKKKELPKIKLDSQKVMLFNQKLQAYGLYSVNVELFPRPTNKLKGKMGESWYSSNVLKRPFYDSTFFFSKTKSKRFSIPYYKIKLETPMRVNNIYIYHDEKAYDSKGKKIALKPAQYRVKAQDNKGSLYTHSDMDTMTYGKEVAIDSDIMTIKKLQDAKGKPVDGLNVFSDKDFSEVYLAFDDLEYLSPTKFINVKKVPTIKVEGYSEKAAVFNALRTRSDKEYNEKLVREIGFKDKKLFRSIQKNVKGFKLPKDSLARLPIDVSIKYALRNHAKILKTGRYMAKSGSFKHLKSTFIIFDESSVYHPTTSVEVAKKTSKLKRGDINKNVKYKDLDFSKGI